MTGSTGCPAVALMLVVVSLGWSVGSIAESPMEGVRTTFEKWVETRRMISKERQEWAVDREVLNERIKLVEGEIASLLEKIAQGKESIQDADKKRTELEAQKERLKSVSGVLVEIVAKLESRTMQLIRRLPDPIRHRIKPLTQSIPSDPNETKLSLGQRFQNVIGILNEVNKFNREITLVSEMRTLPTGGAAEVTSLYLGLGQAYYSWAKGTAAAMGLPSENGWVWEPVRDGVDQIADAVAILKNDKVASFVLLPIKVQE